MKLKDMESSVTVGIVIFNTKLITVRETLRSLRGSEIDLNIVCLCNSPFENYQLSIKEICAEFGCACLSNEPNRGFGAGHNTIWKSVDFEWYICCNPDVIVEPESIRKLIAFATSKHNAALSMPKVLNRDGSLQPLARQHPTLARWIYRQLWRIIPKFIKPFEVKFDYSKSQPIEFVTGCFFLVGKDILRQLDGFDESFFLYAEDADISRRAEQFGVNYYVHDSVIIHEWAADWQRSFVAFYQNMKGILRLWAKHGIFSA